MLFKLRTNGVIFIAMLVVIMLSHDCSKAQNTISTGVPFLLIGPNSRNDGIGETGTGISDDATAMHWNPAGLAFQTVGTEINFTHSPWLPGLGLSDLFYDYLAAKKYIKSLNGTVGASLTYLNIGEVITTNELGQRTYQDYKAYEFAFALGYATKVSKPLGVGVVTRFIYSRLSPQDVQVGNEQGKGTAFVMSFDLATLYKPVSGPKFFKDKFSLGLNLSNMGPKITYVDADQADPLPFQMRLGLAYNVFRNEGNDITIAADFSKLLVNRTDGVADPFYEAMFTSWKGGIPGIAKSIQSSVGIEYWYGSPKLIALRAGYFYEDPSYGNRQFVTLGAGLRYSLYGFDFSYITGTEDNHPLANTLRFGLLVNF
jgi:hypothetical protein